MERPPKWLLPAKTLEMSAGFDKLNNRQGPAPQEGKHKSRHHLRKDQHWKERHKNLLLKEDLGTQAEESQVCEIQGK